MRDSYHQYYNIGIQTDKVVPLSLNQNYPYEGIMFRFGRQQIIIPLVRVRESSLQQIVIETRVWVFFFHSFLWLMVYLLWNPLYQL